MEPCGIVLRAYRRANADGYFIACQHRFKQTPSGRLCRLGGSECRADDARAGMQRAVLDSVVEGMNAAVECIHESGIAGCRACTATHDDGLGCAVAAARVRPDERGLGRAEAGAHHAEAVEQVMPKFRADGRANLIPGESGDETSEVCGQAHALSHSAVSVTCAAAPIIAIVEAQDVRRRS